MKKLLTIAGIALSTLAFAPIATAHASTITVKQGDTLWEYSNKYHVSVQDILKENNIELDKYTMWPGDAINIPDGKENTGTFNNHFVFQAHNDIAKYTAPVSNTASTPVSTPASNVGTSTQASSQSSTPESNDTMGTTSASGRTMEVTFYDPAVLGATTMPGGMYSGVAANLSVFPKGTVLKITLPGGNTIIRTVNDSGAFAAGSPNQLDIAMPNASIPLYGRGTATVEVVK